MDKREWMLEQVETASARRDWTKLPQSFELQAVQALYERTLKVHFNRKDIRPRINASKAGTFDDLRSAVLSMKG